MFDTIRWEEKEIIRAAEKSNLKLGLLDAKKISMELKKREENGNLILQRCVSYFRVLHSTFALENMGHKVINNFRTSLICGNKLFVSLALLNNNIPVPRTFVSFDLEGAKEASLKLGYPFVLKPVVGSWGRLSALIKDQDTLNAILEHREYMFPLYQIYYMQEFVNKPGRDIRTFVLGGQTIAGIYRVSSSDWRTNTARGGKAIACKITKEIDELSIKAAEAVGGEFVGVDLMESSEGLVVHEVNTTTEFKNTVPATGVDIPMLVVNYLKESSRK